MSFNLLLRSKKVHLYCTAFVFAHTFKQAVLDVGSVERVYEICSREGRLDLFE